MSRLEAGPACTVTIDLRALAQNWRRLASAAAPAECAAVVKADAYGIGIARAVPTLTAVGCRTFFVALPDEGRRVRLATPGATIYVLGGFLPAERGLYSAFDLRPALNQQSELAAWVQGGGGAAALQVDTGMNRLGFSVEDALALFAAPELARVDFRLLVSHLARADEPAEPMNGRQLAAFLRLREAAPALPASLANSGGLRLGAEYHLDLVRPGVALYGAVAGHGVDPVVSVQARVLQVREAGPGDSVGYGAAFSLKRPSRIAILAAGYGDGYLRAAGSSDARRGAAVWIGGIRAPLVGRVSMDFTAVDVTDAAEAVRPGDLAELFGAQLPIEEVAEAAETIPYELLTNLSRRAKRIYLGAGSAS